MSDCEVVTVTVPDAWNVSAGGVPSDIVSVTVPNPVSVLAVQPPAVLIGVVETGPPGPPGPAGTSGMSGPTVDTGEIYKIIMFSNGTVLAVPEATEPPATPTGLTRVVRINSVKLTWSHISGASTYAVYRNGSQVATVNTELYRDSNVTVGQTYTYAVQAIDNYGLRSALSSSVSAFIDPALNNAPTIDIRSWPTSVALGNKAIIRVNARDVDAQDLALALDVNVGSLTATIDPSVWILMPV